MKLLRCEIESLNDLIGQAKGILANSEDHTPYILVRGVALLGGYVNEFSEHRDRPELKEISILAKEMGKLLAKQDVNAILEVINDSENAIGSSRMKAFLEAVPKFANNDAVLNDLTKAAKVQYEQRLQIEKQNYTEKAEDILEKFEEFQEDEERFPLAFNLSAAIFFFIKKAKELEITDAKEVKLLEETYKKVKEEAIERSVELPNVLDVLDEHSVFEGSQGEVLVAVIDDLEGEIDDNLFEQLRNRAKEACAASRESEAMIAMFLEMFS